MLLFFFVLFCFVSYFVCFVAARACTCIEYFSSSCTNLILVYEPCTESWVLHNINIVEYTLIDCAAMFGVQLTLSASTSAVGVHLLVARCTVMCRAANDASFSLLRKTVQSVGMPSCMKYSGWSTATAIVECRPQLSHNLGLLIL